MHDTQYERNKTAGTLPLQKQDAISLFHIVFLYFMNTTRKILKREVINGIERFTIVQKHNSMN